MSSRRLIRVQADEVTYNLHILVRFELEQAPALRRPGGRRPARGLEPEVPGMPGHHPGQRRRGLPARHPLEPGCSATSRPTRWATFTRPSFSVCARHELSGLDESFARGDFGELLAWLRDNVHRHGQRYRPVDLIERATGAPLIPGRFWIHSVTSSASCTGFDTPARLRSLRLSVSVQ